MMFTPGSWWKSYNMGTYDIRADGGVVVAKDCTKENAEAIASMPDMLAALKRIRDYLHEREMFGYMMMEVEAAIAKAERRTE